MASSAAGGQHATYQTAGPAPEARGPAAAAQGCAPHEHGWARWRQPSGSRGVGSGGHLASGPAALGLQAPRTGLSPERQQADAGLPRPHGCSLRGAPWHHQQRQAADWAWQEALWVVAMAAPPVLAVAALGVLLVGSHAEASRPPPVLTRTQRTSGCRRPPPAALGTPTPHRTRSRCPPGVPTPPACQGCQRAGRPAHHSRPRSWRSAAPGLGPRAGAGLWSKRVRWPQAQCLWPPQGARSRGSGRPPQGPGGPPPRGCGPQGRSPLRYTLLAPARRHRGRGCQHLQRTLAHWLPPACPRPSGL
mmetsp:Transcript_2804/g.8634  ORF Transcript_2804/g.8634 Transcript_2804/m.8634 type:complete len:304 (+) Transcript_2804:303-1214(+)